MNVVEDFAERFVPEYMVEEAKKDLQLLLSKEYERGRQDMKRDVLVSQGLYGN